MNEKTYTAPAVIARADAVRSTKGSLPPSDDGDKGEGTVPGGVGFSL